MDKSPVYSDPEVLARIGGLALRARRVVEGTLSGHHRSPFHGYSVEFAEYREYTPGEDLRRLDWRVLGRTDRYYVKRYEEETNVRATLVVDASGSMRYSSGPLSKFDYAATLAAALATLLVGQQDAVGLALVDRQARQWLPPAATQARLAEVIAALENATPADETDLGGALETLAEKLKRRGLVIVISDFLTDLPSLWSGLSRLAYRGHEALLLQVLDRAEVELPFDDLTLFHDIEGTEELMAEPWAFRQAYRDAIGEFLRELRDTCGTRGVEYALFHTDQSPSDALSHFLHERMRTSRRGPVGGAAVSR